MARGDEVTGRAGVSARSFITADATLLSPVRSREKDGHVQKRGGVRQPGLHAARCNQYEAVCVARAAETRAGRA